MSERFTKVLLVLALALWAGRASAEPCFQVNLRGGTTQVCTDVYENPFPFTLLTADTILAVHGFTETGDVWKPMKDAIFDHPTLKFEVKRIITVNLPGRLTSPAPPNLAGGPFGNLLIDDYASVLIQVIDALKASGKRVNVVMGHSMGGLEIQAAQEFLLQQGSSLFEHGVLRAVLLASVPNSGTQWTQPPSADVTPFVKFSPALGVYLDLPAVIGQNAGFTKRTTGEVLCLAGFGPPCTGAVPTNFVGLEPIFVAQQLVGLLPGVPRPFARRGAFNSFRGTLLTVVGFNEDALTPAVDQLPLYQYLTATNSNLRYRLVNTPDSVHSMYILNPESLLDNLSPIFNLF